MGVARPGIDAEAMRMLAAGLQSGRTLDAAIAAAAPMAREPVRWLGAAAQARDGGAAAAVLSDLVPESVRLDATLEHLVDDPRLLAVVADAELRVHRISRRVAVAARYPLAVLLVALATTFGLGAYGASLAARLDGTGELADGMYSPETVVGISGVWQVVKPAFSSPLVTMITLLLLVAIATGGAAKLMGRYAAWTRIVSRALPGGRVIDIGHEIEWLERLDALLGRFEAEPADWRRTLAGLSDRRLRRNLESGVGLSDDIAMIRSALVAGDRPRHALAAARARREALVPSLLATMQRGTGYLLLCGAAVFVARLTMHLVAAWYALGSMGHLLPSGPALETMMTLALVAAVAYRFARPRHMRVPMLDLVGGALADGASLRSAATYARATILGDRGAARKQLDQLAALLDAGVDPLEAAQRVATKHKARRALLDRRVAWLLRPNNHTSSSRSAWSDWLMARAGHPVDAWRLIYPLVLAVAVGLLATSLPEIAGVFVAGDPLEASSVGSAWGLGASTLAVVSATIAGVGMLALSLTRQSESLELLVCRVLAASSSGPDDVDRRLDLLAATTRSPVSRRAIAQLRSLVRDGLPLSAALARVRLPRVADAVALPGEQRVAACADLIEAGVERRRRRRETGVAIAFTVGLILLGIAVATVAIAALAPSQLFVVYSTGEITW